MTLPPETGPALPGHVLRALQNSSGWLDSWIVPAVLVGATVLLLTWFVRRRTTSRRAWPVVPAIVTALVLSVAAVANCLSGYVPSVAAAQVLLEGISKRVEGRGRGEVSVVRIPVPPQRHLSVSDTYVYTPPGYRRGDRRYPVVYLIHGSPGLSSDWVVAGDIDNTMDILITSGLVPPMIVVAPDANSASNDDTECLDSTRPGGPQVATYLDRDVVDYVDAHFRTLADARHRVIGGFSMGGYCAVDRGLRSDRYSTILAVAPYDNPGAGGRAMLSTQAEFEAASPSRYIPAGQHHSPVAVFLDTGAGVSAGERAQIQLLADALTRAGEKVEYRLEPGQDHSWTMARLAMAYGLVFAGEQVKGS